MVIKILRVLGAELWRRIKAPQTLNNPVHLEKAMEWLSLAQDINRDGGVPIRYSLVPIRNWHPAGWQPSYPETTGYIIPTFLNYSKFVKNDMYRHRAIRMAEWLVSIQKPDGSIKGGNVDSKSGSLVFDTGQVILGLLAVYRSIEKDNYLSAAKKAGDWIVSVQGESGAWEKYSFDSIPHAYYSRVSWALLELYQICQQEKYLFSARKNIEWVLSQQKSNGWFDCAGFALKNHKEPLTHTIAYTISGVLECGIILKDPKYISSAIASAHAISETIDARGYLPGTYNSEWKSSSKFSCLTGNAQLSIILLRTYEITKNPQFLYAARKINSYLKSVQRIDGKYPEINGAIPGSSPIWGKYEPYSYPNWATKFFADALMLEEELERVANT